MVKLKEIKPGSKEDLFSFGESVGKDMLHAKLYEFDLELPQNFTICFIILNNKI